MNPRSLVLPLLAGTAFLVAAPRSAAAEIKACKSGSIVIGNPKYRGADRPPPTGATAKSDPALAVRAMVFSGKTMYTSNGQEIWSVDLASGALRRVAGEHQKALSKFTDGPCDKARFHNVPGIAILPDGSLIVADQGASALLKVTSPAASASCNVSYLAGTSKPVDFNASAQGEADGPGATAKLQVPAWVAVDSAGNVYFIDLTSSKLRKVAADAQHTVSTVAQLPTGTGGQPYRGLTMLKDKLYAITNTSMSGVVVEIDPKTGTVRKVFEGAAKQLVEISPNTAPALMAITNDGTNLFVTGSGFIWRVTPAGKVTHVAGKGSPTDIPKSYDLAAAHPAKDLLLRIRQADAGTMGATASLAYHDGNLYYRGREDGVYVVKIDCK